MTPLFMLELDVQVGAKNKKEVELKKRLELHA